MEFCEKCGGMLILKEKKAVCASCGRAANKILKLKTTEKIEENNKVSIIKEQEEEYYPILDMACPKCKNRKAYFWTMQTRSSDESVTKFYKCTKCKYTWRVYR